MALCLGCDTTIHEHSALSAASVPGHHVCPEPARYLPGLTEWNPNPSNHPLHSGGRNISVTGQGFSLIQKFAMVVIAEPLQSWRRRREAGSLQSATVGLGMCWRARCVVALKTNLAGT